MPSENRLKHQYIFPHTIPSRISDLLQVNTDHMSERIDEILLVYSMEHEEVDNGRTFCAFSYGKTEGVLWQEISENRSTIFANTNARERLGDEFVV